MEINNTNNDKFFYGIMHIENLIGTVSDVIYSCNEDGKSNIGKVIDKFIYTNFKKLIILNEETWFPTIFGEINLILFSVKGVDPKGMTWEKLQTFPDHKTQIIIINNNLATKPLPTFVNSKYFNHLLIMIADFNIKFNDQFLNKQDLEKICNSYGIYYSFSFLTPTSWMLSDIKKKYSEILYNDYNKFYT